MPVERQSVSEVVTPGKHTSNINYLYNGPQLKETVTIIFLRLVSNLDKAFSESGRQVHRSTSLPDHSRLAPLVHDRTRLAHTKPNWEPVRRLKKITEITN